MLAPSKRDQDADSDNIDARGHESATPSLVLHSSRQHNDYLFTGFRTASSASSSARTRDRSSTVPRTFGNIDGAKTHTSDHPPFLSIHRRVESINDSNSQRRTAWVVQPARVDLEPAAHASTQAPLSVFTSGPALVSEHLKNQLIATEPQGKQPSTATPLETSPPQVPPTETRSKPIPIAVARHQTGDYCGGSIPLTGHPRHSAFFPVPCDRVRSPSPSQHLHHRYTTPVSPLAFDKQPYLRNMGSRPGQQSGPHHHQPSPLSPTSKVQPIPIPNTLPSPLLKEKPKPGTRPAAQGLNLAGLPKYHPANFPTSGDNTPLSPRTIQALNSQKRNPRPVSDAQHALHKYQRDIVAQATRRSGLGLAKPTSPRLIPLGSPAESMTPLTLEGQGDYLLAGSKTGSDADGRKIIEQMIQKENEQRDHPEARGSSNQSPLASPAVTPPV